MLPRGGGERVRDGGAEDPVVDAQMEQVAGVAVEPTDDLGVLPGLPQDSPDRRPRQQSGRFEVGESPSCNDRWRRRWTRVL
jgi:hypothetical protein